MKQVRKRNINIIYYSHIHGIYKDSEPTMVLMNLFAGQQWRNRYREQTYGHGGRGSGERVRGMERVTWKLTIPYVK